MSDVDAHDGSSLGRPAHLDEPRIEKSGHCAHVELLVDHVLRRDRVTLDSARSSRGSEGDGCLCQRPGDTTSTETRSREEAGHRPHAAVEPVLVSSFPRDTEHTDKARILGSWLHCTPTHRFAAQVGDETTGGVRLRIATVRLFSQPKCPLFDGEGSERLSGPQFVPLALADMAGSPISEDGLQILTAHLVGRHDRECCVVGGHRTKLWLRFLSQAPKAAAVHDQHGRSGLA